MAATRSAEQWREVVTEWRASKKSAAAFAKEKGVHPHTLSWWAWRLGSVSGRRPRAKFAEVVVVDTPATPTTPAPEFVVEIDALRIRVSPGFDAGELRRLVAALC